MKYRTETWFPKTDPMSQIAQNRYNTTFKEALIEVTSLCMEKSRLWDFGLLAVYLLLELRDYASATRLKPRTT